MFGKNSFLRYSILGLLLFGISCVEREHTAPLGPLTTPPEAHSSSLASAAQGADAWIYDDSLRSPWLNASWGATPTWNSTDQVFRGSSSVKIVMSSAWAALSIHHGYWHSNPGIDPSLYERLEFAVYAPTAGARITVFFENDQGDAFPKAEYGNLPEQRWVVVSIPTIQLSPNGTRFHRISIQELSGSARTFYVDDLRMVAPSPGPVPPAPPVLMTPEHGATNVDPNPTLAWSPSNGVSSYRVQLALGADFSSLVVDRADISGTSFTVSGLANNTTYSWRVNASNSSGTSEWSASWRFTTRPATVSAPDLTIDADRLRRSIEFRWKYLSPGSCAVIEGCATPGSRRLLRFDVIVPNFGETDLIVGDPADPGNSGNFEWSPCHGHYHFDGFAEYRLLNGSQQIVRGHKQAFCLMDSRQYWSGNPSRGYDCDYQGISVGWADVYARTIDCQWVDITGLRAGDYTLEVEINVAGKIEEGDNRWPNVVRVPVRIP